MPNVFPSIKAPLNEESQRSVLSKPMNYGGAGRAPIAPFTAPVAQGFAVPPAPVGGGRSSSPGMSGSFGSHFNQRFDPDTQSWVPLTISAIPGDAPSHTSPFASNGLQGFDDLQNPSFFHPTDLPVAHSWDQPRGFKSGGTTEPGETALVGESGPELIRGLPDGSVSVLPNDLLRGSGSDLEIKPGSPYLGNGPNFSTGFGGRYSNPPPAPVAQQSPPSADPAYSGSLGIVADRTPALKPVADIAPAPPSAQSSAPPRAPVEVPTMDDGGLAGSVMQGASPGVLAAPEGVPGLMGGATSWQQEGLGDDSEPSDVVPASTAASSAEAFRAAANNPIMPGGVANPNVPPPAPQMGMIPPPQTSPQDKWNAGRNPLREQIALERFHRSHPLAGPQSDLMREAKRQEVNREAEKFNLGEQQKRVETLRKTAHNIAQEQHWDDAIKGKNAVETAKLQETARKEQEKRRGEAMDLSDALGNVETRLNSLARSDPNYQEKASLLSHIMNQKTSKGVAAGVKYYDETHPTEIDQAGGGKAVMAPAGTYHQLPAPKDDAAKNHQQTIQHFQTAFPNFNDANDAPPKGSPQGTLGPIRAMMLEDYNTARSALKGAQGPSPAPSQSPATDAVTAALSKIKKGG